MSDYIKTWTQKTCNKTISYITYNMMQLQQILNKIFMPIMRHLLWH